MLGCILPHHHSNWSRMAEFLCSCGFASIFLAITSPLTKFCPLQTEQGRAKSRWQGIG